MILTSAMDRHTPLTSAGKPFPGVDVQILIQSDDDEIAPRVAREEEVGELIVHSPEMMLEYLDNPIATEYSLRNGWFFTGDLARKDDQGFYYITGRRQIRINVGGDKVLPEEVEEILYRHHGIKEVAVVGRFNPGRGEVVHAIIVPTGKPPTLTEIRHFCRPFLLPYKIPRSIQISDKLPRSDNGKIIRSAL